MTLTEHLEELRRRLIAGIAALFIGTCVAWIWSGELLSWLARPAGGLIFVAPTEAFFSRLKVSFFGGFLLSLPVILYEIWAFVACALDEPVRKVVSVLVPLSYFLFVAGIALSVFLVVPTAIRFLLSYGSADVVPMMTVGAYVGFVAAISIAFGLVFQIPLVLTFLNRAGVIRRDSLGAKRRYVYFGAFVVAALLTPGPDVFSQLALAIPIVVLFEGSMLAMRWTEPAP